MNTTPTIPGLRSTSNPELILHAFAAFLRSPGDSQSNEVVANYNKENGTTFPMFGTVGLLVIDTLRRVCRVQLADYNWANWKQG